MTHRIPDDDPPPRVDPLEVTRQPAIRMGRRRQWLVPSGLLAAITIAVLVASVQIDPVVPVVGIALVAGLYAAMVVVAVAVRAVRRRNSALAVLLLVMAAAGTVDVVLLLAVATSGRSA